MAATVNRTEFTNISGDDFVIDFTTTFSSTQPGSYTDIFNCNGFEFMQEGEETLLGILPQRVNISLIATDNNEYNNIKNMFTRGDETWWLLIYKDEELWWKGLLNMLPTNYDYSVETQEFNFTAFDMIASLKGRKLWEQWPGYYGAEPERKHGYALFTKPAIHHGFGFRRAQSPSVGSDGQIPLYNFQHDGNNYTKAWTFDWQLVDFAYPVGFVYSLLYDLVIDKVGLQSFNMAWWDRNTTSGDGNTEVMNANLPIDIQNFIYDKTKPYSVGAFSFLETIDSLDCYDLLNEFVKYMRGRLFQYNGEYYFIQAECYQKTTDINIRVHDNDSGNSGNLTRIMDTSSSSSTIPTSDFIIDLTSPRTEGMQNINIEILDPFRKVSLSMNDRVWGNKDKFYSYVNRGGYVNFSGQRANEHEMEIKSFGTADVHNNFVIYRRYALTTNGGFAKLGQHYVDFIAEAFSSPREKINSSILASDYTQLKRLDFNSKSYLPTRLKYNAEYDAWEGEWVEFDLDRTLIDS